MICGVVEVCLPGRVPALVAAGGDPLFDGGVGLQELIVRTVVNSGGGGTCGQRLSLSEEDLRTLIFR